MYGFAVSSFVFSNLGDPISGGISKSIVSRRILPASVFLTTSFCLSPQIYLWIIVRSLKLVLNEQKSDEVRLQQVWRNLKSCNSLLLRAASPRICKISPKHVKLQPNFRKIHLGNNLIATIAYSPTSRPIKKGPRQSKRIQLN